LIPEDESTNELIMDLYVKSNNRVEAEQWMARRKSFIPDTQPFHGCAFLEIMIYSNRSNYILAVINCTRKTTGGAC